jgi:two-component system, NarL family, sensor kinase
VDIVAAPGQNRTSRSIVMSRPHVARLAWSLSAVAVVLLLAAVGFAIALAGHPLPADLSPNAAVDAALVLIGVTLAGVGGLVAARLPANPIGWLFLAGALGVGLSGIGQGYGTEGIFVRHGGWPAAAWGIWLTWASYVLVVAVALAMQLFPTGRPLPGRWRWAARLTVLALVLVPVGGMLDGGALDGEGGVQNPLHAPRWISGISDDFVLLLPLCAVVAACSLFVRRRRAVGVERLQLRWVMCAGVCVGLTVLNCLVVSLAGGNEALIFVPMLVAFALFALATGAAVLRYRIYDLDLLVNRALVYAGLTAAVVAVYVAVVGGASMLLRDRHSFWPPLLATALVAVGAQPLRARLQRGLNRLMFGERDDPYVAISRLGERLEAAVEPAAVSTTIVETVAQALRVPYAALDLLRDGVHDRIARHGRPGGGAPFHVPLTYQGEPVGRLELAPRAGGDELSAADQRLLADLARQAGVAAHAARLATDLQASRERLVTAREEERRRLRRDLHDGLGPALAGAALQTEAARGLVDTDAAEARAALADLKGQLQDAIADIRRLVYGLRPPALDELGLAVALRQQAGNLSGNGSSGLAVEVRAPCPLRALPAAVEVAAYRIALEALVNAARHAKATRCTIEVSVNGGLEVDVSDDGVGLASGHRRGVGLSSMRERAAELGGSCVVGSSASGGTRVHVVLPLAEEV